MPFHLSAVKNLFSSDNKFMSEAKHFGVFELAKYDEYAATLRKNAKPTVPRSFGISLLAVADTHGSLAEADAKFRLFAEKASKCDLCVILGDVSSDDVRLILTAVPKKKILAVTGNHDAFGLFESFGVREISGKSVAYSGVTFAGISGSFRYKNEKFPSHTQYESLKKFRNLASADVLLTHDAAFESSNCSVSHAGLIGITQYISENAPTWHIHGHLHKSYTKTYPNGTTEKCGYMFERVEI